jgi:hypothetical protein
VLCSTGCAAAVRPSLPPRRRPFQIADRGREIDRGERDETVVRTDSGFVPRGKGHVSISRRNEGDWEGIERGRIPGGFNRTHPRKKSGLNPGELDPGCQTGFGPDPGRGGTKRTRPKGDFFWAPETASGWWTAQAEKNSLAVGPLFLTTKPRVRANP